MDVTELEDWEQYEGVVLATLEDRAVSLCYQALQLYQTPEADLGKGVAAAEFLLDLSRALNPDRESRRRKRLEALLAALRVYSAELDRARWK